MKNNDKKGGLPAIVQGLFGGKVPAEAAPQMTPTDDDKVAMMASLDERAETAVAGIWYGPGSVVVDRYFVEALKIAFAKTPGKLQKSSINEIVGRAALLTTAALNQRGQLLALNSNLVANAEEDTRAAFDDFDKASAADQYAVIPGKLDDSFLVFHESEAEDDPPLWVPLGSAPDGFEPSLFSVGHISKFEDEIKRSVPTPPAGLPPTFMLVPITATAETIAAVAKDEGQII